MPRPAETGKTKNKAGIEEARTHLKQVKQETTILGLEQTRTRFRLFALTPAIGMLGVIASLPIWFPVAASAICFTMLPIAYLTFLIMNNKRSYIGAAVGQGASRIAFNVLLIVALLVATVGSVIQINNRVLQNNSVRQLFGFGSAAASTTPEERPADEPATETPTGKTPE